MIDLHMHSRYSDDGEFTPEELVRQCAEAGVKLFSIADHNTFRANEAAASAAKAAGIGYIPAIEVDCRFRGGEYHMLCYGVDDRFGDFTRFESLIDREIKNAAMQMLEKTRALGFEISLEEMAEVSKDCYWDGHWTGEMFGEVLLANPKYAGHPLLAPYRPGGSRSVNHLVCFFWDYYAQGGKCYVPMQTPDMEDVVESIHRCGGMAVLAHPGAYLQGKEDTLEAIAALGIDGMEAFSSYHDADLAAHYYRRARELGKLPTCGSDYHGRIKPNISMGGITFPKEIDRRTIEAEVRGAMAHLLC